uniref:Arabidopsis retrotransposon Orf1 C-terminal domain-containing protein n=1 Tax=Chenopodium quinoa TaxID=63459 RepID=A0A803MXX0_CHEQI
MARSTTTRNKKTSGVSRPVPVSKTSTSKKKSSITKGRVSSTKTKEKVVVDYSDIKFRDGEHKAKYERLFERGVTATRLCDVDALKTLNIEDDVQWLFSNVGWEPGCGEGSISFQLYNEEHTWTLARFNEVLGLPPGGLRLTPLRWSTDPVWKLLTGESTYDSKMSPTNHIRHPALRYVQRLLANTVFGRQEGSKARKDELFMIYQMLHAQPTDTGAFLIKQMKELANTTTKKGAIVLGGLITPIALHLGHKERLMKEESIEGTDCIDIPACSLMGWIRKKDGTTLWCIRNDEDELPPGKELSLRDKANWSFVGVHPRTRTQILSEPVPAPYVSNGTSSCSILTEKVLTDLLTSIDKINNEQREIKEQLIVLWLGGHSTLLAKRDLGFVQLETNAVKDCIALYGALVLVHVVPFLSLAETMVGALRFHESRSVCGMHPDFGQ